MEQEEKDITLIEDFYKGNLSEKAILAFEDRRKNDPDFDEKVEDYLLIFGEVEDKGVHDFMTTLKEWEADHAPKAESRELQPYLKYAAIIFLLILPLGLWWFGQSSSPSNTELYIAYFEPYEDVITTRSGSQDSLLMIGMTAYNSKNYDDAIPPLSSFVKQNVNSFAGMTYLAICYLETDKASKAIPLLENTNQNAEGLFQEVAEWYLALAYLKEGKFQSSKGILTNIQNQEDHLYFDQAKILLEKI